MIYLFDDYMPQNGELCFNEYSTCLKTFKSVPDDINDIWRDKDAIFFYHTSLKKVDVIKKSIYKPNVSYIGFSGSFNNTKEFSSGWNMSRKTFYSNLKSFLDRYKIDNTISVKNFFDKETTVDNEVIVKPGDKDIICFNDKFLSGNPVDINEPSEVEKFINEHVKEKKVIVFDLDSEALSPTKISYLGAYIRLSLDTIKKAALAPFIFIGENEFFDYINKFQDTEYQNILLWAGSIFRYNKKTEDNDFLKDITPLTPNDYINKFLKNLKIAPKGITGNHTIANYWGAYVVARHIEGCEDKAEELYKYALEKDALYLKYLIVDRIRSVKEIDDIIKAGAKDAIKKIEPLDFIGEYDEFDILLIDDQDDIWEGVIKALLPGANLTVIGKKNKMINEDTVSCFLTKEAKKILNRDFDLILLDLRLGGAAEEYIVNGDECSGMNILKEITDKNPGQQVIMFTSSNKAWNLKKALTKAAGYYIKESPLQPFTEDETIQNIKAFLDTIKSCWNYRKLKYVIEEMRSLKHLEFKDEYRDAEVNSTCVRDQLDIVRTMAISQSREIGSQGKNWTYVYIALFQVLEIVKRLNYKYNPADPGNKEKDPDRFLGRLVFNLISDGLSSEQRNSCNIGLKYHNDLRAKLVHRRNKPTDNYPEFLDLWDLIFDILRELIY